MTKAQARQKVWKQVAGFLSVAIAGRAPWLEYTRATECLPLSKKDRERVLEAAKEVLGELEQKASEL